MIAYYFDEHMRRSVVDALIQQGFDVIMAVDVGMTGKDDDTEHLPYASSQNRVMVTFDRPFAGRTMRHSDHTGLICLSEKLRNDIGGTIEQLSKFAEIYDLQDVTGQVFWLP